MYVRSVRARDFRCFERLEIELLTPGSDISPRPFPISKNLNVLLGNNGAGKTSVLRAIALAALGSTVQASGYRPLGLVRRAAEGGPTDATVTADLELDPSEEQTLGTSSMTVEAKIERLGSSERFVSTSPTVGTVLVGPGAVVGAGPASHPAEELERQLFDDAWPGFFVVGYGSSRRVEAPESYDPVARIKSRGPRFQRVAGLFEEHFSLAPISSWFREVREPVREKVARLLDRLIPGDTRILSQLEAGDVVFEHHGLRLGFHQLSDGYRAYIGWVADLLGHCHRIHEERFDEASGVVLVDEVDLHLHPSWQRSALPSLAQAFPRLQFVVTTHSPIVAGTITSQNLSVLEWEGREAPTLSRPTQEVWGLSADQILTGETFGLHTTRNEPFTEALRKVREEEGSDASREFSRMLALGGAGIGTPEAAAVPEWVEALATRAAKTTPTKKVRKKQPAARKAGPKTTAKPRGASTRRA